MSVKISLINYDQSGRDSKELKPQSKPQLPNDLHLQTIKSKEIAECIICEIKLHPTLALEA